MPALFPNPVMDKLYVNVQDKVQFINVVDLSGRKLITAQNSINGLTEINTSALESGIYILQLIDSNNKIKNLKFIKK